MKRYRWIFYAQMALGVLYLAKSLAVGIPLPPNTGMVHPWTDKSWLEQYGHWQDQVAQLESIPHSERGTIWPPLHAATVDQFRLARFYLLSGIGIGVGLIGTAFLWPWPRRRKLSFD